MKPKILIVDDEPLNLATLEAFLAHDGYQLHFAGNGRDACELAHTLQPDLILLDVMMPQMDGFTVCRRIRQDPVIGRVPIIVVTALSDSHSRIEGLNAGADDFLTKPCRPEEIRARVRTVVSLNRFRAIAEQNERFQRLYELAPSAIVLADERGVVVGANRLAEALLAVGSGRALCEDSLYSRFERAAGEVVRDAIGAALRGTTAPVGELRRGAGDGERILQVRATAISDKGVRLAMLIFANVTEEVRAREALEKLNRELDGLVQARTKQLEEANGLLLSYASFVSHDLRSPLTVIKGYLSLLHEGAVPLDADAAPLIAQAYNGAVVMQELVQNILQLAQDEHARPAADAARPAVDPAPIARRLCPQVASFFPAVAVEFVVGDLPAVGASPVLIERVFYNLLTNAIKYSARRNPARIELGGFISPEGPVVFVRDNGVGFDARDADKLFREFSRLGTAGSSDGFGLGLSLVAKLIRAHGGRIWAEGAVDAGATFYVQLPAPRPASTAAAEPTLSSIASA